MKKLGFLLIIMVWVLSPSLSFGQPYDSEGLSQDVFTDQQRSLSNSLIAEYEEQIKESTLRYEELKGKVVENVEKANLVREQAALYKEKARLYGQKSKLLEGRVRSYVREVNAYVAEIEELEKRLEKLKSNAALKN